MANFDCENAVNCKNSGSSIEMVNFFMPLHFNVNNGVSREAGSGGSEINREIKG